MYFLILEFVSNYIKILYQFESLSKTLLEKSNTKGENHKVKYVYTAKKDFFYY